MNILINKDSKLTQIIAGANVESQITELANWLANKNVICNFLKGANFTLNKVIIDGGKIREIEKKHKLPSYCFEGPNNLENNSVNFALITGYIIERVKRAKCFK